MQKKYFKNKKCGFTIIETMISVAIFLIIVTISMEALLNVSFIHQKSQNARSIMDSLNFVMDDMSRNIRTGYDYGCLNEESTNIGDCPLGGETPGPGISFTSSDGISHVVYELRYDNNNVLYIQKSIDGGIPMRLTSEQVNLDLGSSGFNVSGAAGIGDGLQPIVTIRLNGSITTKGNVTPFSLQTSVSQRQIDI